MAEEKSLQDFKTCELVEELVKREGVEAEIVDPYENETIVVDGPARVLVVTD